MESSAKGIHREERGREEGGREEGGREEGGREEEGREENGLGHAMQAILCPQWTYRAVRGTPMGTSLPAFEIRQKFRHLHGL